MNVNKSAVPTNTANLHKTRIDIKAESRVELCKLINQQLVDTFDLYSQSKQAHWNVKGIHFLQTHELFDKIAQDIFPFVDTLAERITTLGGVANATSRMTAATSRLDEFPEGSGNSEKFLSALADRFAHVAKTTRAAIGKSDELGDPNTADIFTAVSNQLDESLWFIEAHLQNG
jgi:starvation-inducible DNA-binding protein